MGISKTEKYTAQQAKLAQMAKALSHPARVAILQFLLKKKTCFCGDIVEELPIAQSTVSQHLKELKQAGLIKGTIAGTSTCYCVDEKNWLKAQKVFHDFFEKMPSTSKQCC